MTFIIARFKNHFFEQISSNNDEFIYSRPFYSHRFHNSVVISCSFFHGSFMRHRGQFFGRDEF